MQRSDVSSAALSPAGDRRWNLGLECIVLTAYYRRDPVDSYQSRVWRIWFLCPCSYLNSMLLQYEQLLCRVSARS